MSSTSARLGGIAAMALGAAIGLAPVAGAVVNPAAPPPVLANDKCQGPNCGPCEHCKPHCVGEFCPPKPKPPEHEVPAPPPPPPAAPPAAPPPAAPPAAPPAQQQPPAQQAPTTRPPAQQRPQQQHKPQVAQKPHGAVQAGGGATADDRSDALGPLGLAGGAAATALGGAYLFHRRRAAQRS
ncbi:hypothetical protein GCM10025787_57290 [Saccharopolyspora rosea]